MQAGAGRPGCGWPRRDRDMMHGQLGWASTELPLDETRRMYLHESLTRPCRPGIASGTGCVATARDTRGTTRLAFQRWWWTQLLCLYLSIWTMQECIVWLAWPPGMPARSCPDHFFTGNPYVGRVLTVPVLPKSTSVAASCRGFSWPCSIHYIFARVRPTPNI